MTELTATFKPIDDETWEAACEVVNRITQGFWSGNRYYAKRGDSLRRLRTVHDVINTVLEDGEVITILPHF